MTDINGLQKAMQTWRMAFADLSEYFENNDILEPDNLSHWILLVEAQDSAQAEVKRLIRFCRDRL